LIVTGPVGRPFVDQQLDEGTLFRAQFPRGAFFAGPQPDDCAPDPDRLAGFQFEVACQAIALVEEAKRRDAFRHRCPDLFGDRRDQITVGCRNHGFLGRLTGSIFIDIVAAEPAAAGQQDRRQNRECNGVARHACHSASAGFQDS
tara:strand:+ start:1544 stop:1978 length:435 start_codon:yes stop_codon:yes gene_type:complete